MLADTIKVALANTFAFYVKAQFFHWNVTGPNFKEYHELFGMIYEDANAAIDVMGELLRTLNEVAPSSLSRYKQLTIIEDAETVPAPVDMINALHEDNKTVLASLLTAYKAAEDAGEVGISNSLQDRITQHEKWGWFLRASA